jgi:hypothetical protein
MLAFGIFIFQMQNSFRKYYQEPVIEERALTSKYVTKQPVFFVCQVDQFDYTAALANGYGGHIDWAKGKLMDSKKITWKGKDGNISFDQLFDSDYRSFKSVFSETEDVFYPRYGVCKKVTDNNSEVYVKTQKRSIFLIVDPNLESNLRVIEMENGRLYCGPTHDDRFDKIAYNLEYRFHDSKINDGQSCTDYERSNSSYGDCIEGIMERMFLDSYGCLPPWFLRNKGMTCETEKEVAEPQKNKLIEFIKFMLGRDLKLYESCLPPCIKMIIGIKKTTHSTNHHEYAQLSFVTKEEVVVYKDTYSYDTFNLVVDIGSALGLWLGRSVLCIFDKFMEFCLWLAIRNCK